ncbi:UNVERIFIED_CONTAM: hypothetical protein PYX00_008828 [Menopon gallinae]|uniref:Craniofacial development protein 2-like n=1 Tax=Menopon gallinae TaxID=328185 RepID=A0AAW2HPF7_9NEOP
MKADGYTFFYSSTSTTRQHNIRRQYGVAFAVANNYLHTVKRFTPVNDRIYHIRIKSKPQDICIINAYAPTEDKEEDIKEEFYELLEHTYDNLPTHCVRIVIGDMNAQIGKENHFRPTIGPDSLHETCNDNGNRLVNFAISKNMTIASTYFPRKNIHKHTWTSPDGLTKNQIDHVLIDTKSRTNIHNVRSYRGSPFPTDHYMVGVIMKNKMIHKKNHQTATKQKRFNVEKLKIESAKTNYAKNIQQTIDPPETLEPNRIWEEIERVVVKCAEECLGYPEKIKRNPWYDKECEQVMKERNAAYHLSIQNPDATAVTQYRELRKEGRRPRGRPRTRYVDSIKEDMARIDTQATMDHALDREGWKELVMKAKVFNGPLSLD